MQKRLYGRHRMSQQRPDGAYTRIEYTRLWLHYVVCSPTNTMQPGLQNLLAAQAAASTSDERARASEDKAGGLVSALATAKSTLHAAQAAASTSDERAWASEDTSGCQLASANSVRERSSSGSWNAAGAGASVRTQPDAGREQEFAQIQGYVFRIKTLARAAEIDSSYLIGYRLKGAVSCLFDGYPLAFYAVRNIVTGSHFTAASLGHANTSLRLVEVNALASADCRGATQPRKQKADWDEFAGQTTPDHAVCKVHRPSSIYERMRREEYCTIYKTKLPGCQCMAHQL